jgi:hypothetical protein
VLLDFGLARGVAGQTTLMTITKTIPGYSMHYASLEQIQGEKPIRAAISTRCPRRSIIS